MHSARKKNGGGRGRLKGATWRMYLLIVVLGLLVAGVIGYGLYICYQMKSVYRPLATGAMGIKLEVTTAHLRLHDQDLNEMNHTDMRAIWSHFGKADQYIRAMLGEEEGAGGIGIAPGGDQLRRKLTKLRETLDNLQSAARQEFQPDAAHEAGTAIDRRFNTAFSLFLHQIDDIHADLFEIMDRDIHNLRLMQMALIGICLALFLFVGLVFHRFNKQLAMDLTDLREMRKSLEREVAERKKAEESLRNSHDMLEQKVKERTFKLNEANEKLTREIQEREKYEEQLRESRKQLKDLSSRLMESGEGLRKEIAKNLHDSLGQMLSAVKYSVENALSQNSGNRETDEQSLAKIVPMIQTAIEEVRRISMELRPSILDDLGILATIGWFCREFESVYSTIAVEKNIDVEEDDLPENMKIVIYRILQEAMNNVAKHSKAESVTIGLKHMDGSIVLSIADDGQGFDPRIMQPKSVSIKGLGLASMRERAEFSGGVFSVQSAPGQGTTVEALWSKEAVERFIPSGAEVQ